jgi:predicted NBD/HSP70 family sugar kinase
MNVLAIDIGGTNIKILATGQKDPRRFPSSKQMTPEAFVSGVKDLVKDWKYEAVSIGYPGIVKEGRIITEPHNLATGWIGFDFKAAFGCLVKIINDAAMQALGSYSSGILLFLGLGTGLGSSLVSEGVVIPMEVAHLSYRKGTFEDYLGAGGKEHLGVKKWSKHIAICVEQLADAVHPDDIVLGGGNAKKLKELPAGCRLGDNTFAFKGGFRLWEKPKNNTYKKSIKL